MWLACVRCGQRDTKLPGTVFSTRRGLVFPVALPSVHTLSWGAILKISPICGSGLGCLSAAINSCEPLSLGLDVILHGGSVRSRSQGSWGTVAWDELLELGHSLWDLSSSLF